MRLSGAVTSGHSVYDSWTLKSREMQCSSYYEETITLNYLGISENWMFLSKVGIHPTNVYGTSAR